MDARFSAGFSRWSEIFENFLGANREAGHYMTASRLAGTRFAYLWLVSTMLDEGIFEEEDSRQSRERK
jgi:hypothetical protein